MDLQETKMELGWREWVSLPDLGLVAIKAKVDTGAKTSALHAFKVIPYEENGIEMVRFFVHPIQNNRNFYIECTVPVKEQRKVRDSGGHMEMRYVIETDVKISNKRFPIELTLTNRDTMKFRMLLGRSALKNRAIVDPAISYMNGKLDAPLLYNLRIRDEL